MATAMCLGQSAPFKTSGYGPYNAGYGPFRIAGHICTSYTTSQQGHTL